MVIKVKIINGDDMLKDFENINTEKDVLKVLKKYSDADHFNAVIINYAISLLKTSNRQKGTMIINRFLKSEEDEITKYIVLAYYYFETGDIENGKLYLIKIAKETTINYEFSLEFRGWLDVWNKYKKYVQGEIPPSRNSNDEEDMSDDELMELLLEEVHSGGYDAYLSYNGEHFKRTLKIAKKRKMIGLTKQLQRIKSKFPDGTIDDDAEEIIEEYNLNFDDEDELFYSEICHEFEN